MFAATISAIAQMVNDNKRANVTRCSVANRCQRCGSDTVTTRGPGRTAIFDGVIVAVPSEMQLVRCRDCGTSSRHELRKQSYVKSLIVTTSGTEAAVTGPSYVEPSAGAVGARCRADRSLPGYARDPRIGCS